MAVWQPVRINRYDVTGSMVSQEMYLAYGRIARKEVSDFSMDTDEATCSNLGDADRPHSWSPGCRMQKKSYSLDVGILHTQS
jgi:hypothetical protein